MTIGESPNQVGGSSDNPSVLPINPLLGKLAIDQASKWGDKPCTHPGIVAASDTKDKCTASGAVSLWTLEKQNRN